MTKIKRPVHALGLILLAAALCFGYALWEFRQIKVTRLALNAPDARLRGIKIVYAVDFQYDRSPDRGGVDEALFQKAIDTIAAQHADVILLGGDYVTYASNWAQVVPYLSQLRAPLGVYGIFGNHDYGAKDALPSRLPNIRFLENESVRVPYNGTELLISGVEDLWMGEPECPADDGQSGLYHILLTHNPDFFERMEQAEKRLYDLTLAGHIHAGQVTVFGIAGIPKVLSHVTRFGEKYRYGEKVLDGHRIYVSSGLGGMVYNLPIRFGAQPEIVVLSQG